jgi:outer membrane protein assembly factor BamB
MALTSLLILRRLAQRGLALRDAAAGGGFLGRRRGSIRFQPVDYSLECGGAGAAGVALPTGGCPPPRARRKNRGYKALDLHPEHFGCRLMRPRALVAILFAFLFLAGCSWFETKKQPLPGERIPVLALDHQLAPDQALAKSPIALPRPQVNRDWPQPGGDPDHLMQNPALPERLAQAWKVSVGAGSSRYTRVMAPPVVAQGRVYAMDGGVRVGAWSAANGAALWQVDLRPPKDLGNAFGGGVAFSKNRLFVATGYGRVAALDPATGKVIWDVTVGAPVHSGPTVANGRVFVITVENELFALNAADGKELWEHVGLPQTASLLGGASPAVEGEVVIAPFSSGELDALEVENGLPLWSDNLASARNLDAVAALADIRGRPVVDGARVFAASHSGRLAAIDLRSGERGWEHEIGSDHGPWLAGDYLFLLTTDQTLLCLARDGGKVRWLRQLPKYENEKKREDPIEWAGPVLGGDRLILVSSNGWALSVSPNTGALLGRQQLPGPAYLGPVIAGNTLYVLTDDAELTAFR